jgi:hypothetical protein
LNETLSAKLGAETSDVTVDYHFVNTGGVDVVTVGFPVDLMPAPGENTSYNVDRWQKDGLENLRILDGGTLLPTERTLEETLSPDIRPKQLKDVSVTRRWSIATLKFKARETKHVRVTYTVKTMGVNTGFEGDPHIKFSPRTFLYTFRTAKGWGPGRVRKLEIVLDLVYLRQNRFPVLEMEPKLKEAAGGIWRSEFHSMELDKMPDLMVRYDSTPALFQLSAEPLRLSRSNWQLSMCGAGKLGGNTLTDGNPATSWAPEFANGVGACFEFQPRNGSYIEAIAILNGNQTSAAAYAEHSRIRKVRIDYVLDLEEGPKHETSEQTFPDRTFDDRTVRFPTNRADFLDLPAGPEGLIADVKLTVLELYPGAGRAPLALSEIYVYGTNRKN